MVELSIKNLEKSKGSLLTRDLNKLVKKGIGVYLGLLVLMVIASVLSPVFLKPDNIFNTLRQASAIGIVSIGATLVILCGGIDLSVSAILSLAACMATGMMAGQDGMSLPVTLAVLTMGAAFGLINGIIITKRRVEPFIITLGMQTVVQGIVLIYTKGSPVGQIAKSFRFIGAGYVWIIPVPVIMFSIILAASLIILHRTVFGRYVYATGGNYEAARLSGIKVDRIKIAVYTLSGLSAAIAGLVLAARVGVGDPNIGRGYDLDAIAAVVIGGTSMAGGVGGLGGTVAGVLIMAIMNNLLNLLNISPFIQQLVKGIIIICAVVFQKRRK